MEASELLCKKGLGATLYVGVGIEVLSGSESTLRFSRLSIYLEWLRRGLLEIVEALKTSSPLCTPLMAVQAIW